VQGFDTNVEQTTLHGCNWEDSISTQVTWQQTFLENAKRSEEYGKKMAKILKISDPDRQEQELEDLQNSDLVHSVQLPRPCGWPVLPVDETDGFIAGIPPFEICMMVDPQCTFGRESTLSMFRNAFGDLPQHAIMQLTRMIHKGVDDELEGADSNISNFLPPAKLLDTFQRKIEFTPTVNNMKGFFVAGHYRAQFSRNMALLRTVEAELRTAGYVKYLQDSLRIHEAIVTNNNLRSRNAESSMKYIAMVGGGLNANIKALRKKMFPQENAQAMGDDVLDAAFMSDKTSWQRQVLTSFDPFQQYAWEYETLNQIFNMSYVQLTPSNLKACNEIDNASIMYRMGQTNPHVTRMGMPVVVSNACGKLTIKEPGSNKRVPDTTKVCSSGLDYVKWVNDLRRLTYKVLLGVHDDGDRQKIVTWRRTTVRSLYDYCTFVESKLTYVPEDVGFDVAMNEGPENSYDIVKALFDQVDRDDEPDCPIISTADPNRTNNRKTSTSEPLKGFKLFLTFMGKNNLLEPKAEHRYLQMLIASYLCPTNGPNDDAWMTNGLGVAYEAPYVQDSASWSRLGRKGVNKVAMPMARMKGAVPSDIEQAEWAGFLSMTKMVAGTKVAISNKLGFYDIPLHYATKGLCDFFNAVISEHLKVMMVPDDWKNFTRYVQSMICRKIADTVLKVTYQCLCVTRDPWEAELEAVKRLSINGLQPSVIPSLFCEVLERVLDYRKLLVTSIVIPYIGVPVLQLDSVLQFLSGNVITNEHDRVALRNWLRTCVENNHFLPLLDSGLGECDPNNNITPYVSTQFLSVIHQQNSEYSELRSCPGPPTADREPTSVAMRSIVTKLFRTNVSTLKMCAFLEDENALMAAMISVKDSDVDMRGFFGGMELYHNSRELLHLGSGIPCSGMQSQFDGAQTTKADPFMIMRRISASRNDYAIGFRAWDLLLMASLLRRPRRDYGIVSDFARSLTQHLCGMVPAAVLPYEQVVSCRLDPFSWDQTHIVIPPPETRPTVMLRFRDSRANGRGATFSYSSPSITGLMEDDFHMASTIAFATRMQLEDFTQVRLDLLNPDMHLLPGITYPMIHYDNIPKHASLHLPHKGIICLHVNDQRLSYQIYVQTPESLAEIERQPNPDPDFRCSMQLHGEFSPNYLTGDKFIKTPDFYQCQKLVYQSGIGPMPSPRRDGFAVRATADGDVPSRALLCMVRHEHGRNGCTNPTGTCFFCVGNPLYEFQSDVDEPIHRRPAIKALSALSIVKVGTQLLLDPTCPGLLASFPASSHSEIPRKRRRDLPSDGATDVVDEDHNTLLVWLQVPTNLSNAPCKLYVSIQCKHAGGEMRPYILHVAPKYLRLPKTVDSTAFCRQYVIVS
jgi:hypothetical protein